MNPHTKPTITIHIKIEGVKKNKNLGLNKKTSGRKAIVLV